MLLGVFFLGLSLNLTPCVYPMLTITLSIFRGSGTEKHHRTFLKALAYVLGIVTMYTALGTAAAYTGQFFGSLLQNFWVLLITGILVIALSLSMFGLYTFRLPSWIIPRERVSKRTLLGFFISGLWVGIVAAPCMGPAVLALLTLVSNQQDVLFGASVFFVMAFGMGLPYLVLGTFSGLLKKLPQSGAWLVWFERLLGVVLFTFGCFYLVIAFRWPFVSWIVPVAFLIGGVYLGWFERSSNESKKFLFFKGAAGMLITGAGFVMLAGLVSFHSPSGIPWEKYQPGILEEAQENGQPVVLDFYADWCIPCHELEKYTYADPSVRRALRNFRLIKVDATYLDGKEINDLVDRFDVSGVPAIIFLDEKGLEVEEMRFNGFVPAGQFLEGIRSGPLAKHAQQEPEVPGASRSPRA